MDKRKGRAWKFGDGISTDHIAPGRFFHLRSNLPDLAKHVLEDARPEFPSNVKPGDFVVGQSADYFRQPLILPQTIKNQCRLPYLGASRCNPVDSNCLHYPQFFTEFCQTLQQTIQRSRGNQHVSLPQRRDNTLNAACRLGNPPLHWF